MRVLRAKINYNDGYCNNPELQVLVDKIPELKDLDYKVIRRKDCGTGMNLYLAEKEGYVNFMAWSGKGNDNGCCGMEWQIIVNGKPVLVRGPWSSRSGVMNMFFKTQCMEVAITDNAESFEKGYTFIAGALTVEKVLKEVLPFLHHSVMLLRIVDKEGEITYVPVKLHEPYMKEISIMKIKKEK